MSRHDINIQDRLIVALDVPSVERARALVTQLNSHVNFFKIGMQLQYAGGMAFIKELKDLGKKVFLDVKLYDIDATVEKAVRNISLLGVDFLTIHAVGRTVHAARAGLTDDNLKLLGVTVLTSHDENDKESMGVAPDINLSHLVERRAKLALSQGAHGIVASGLEVPILRQNLGHDFLIIVPGIRPQGMALNDQKRVVTPQDAIKFGADYIVVGRPITQDQEPAKVAENIQSSLS